MIELNLNQPEEKLELDNKFTWMQKSQYNHLASMEWTREFNSDGEITFDKVDGNYLAHREWSGYECLFRDMTNLEEKVVLDFGCGLGKNIDAYNKRFKQIDGVDLCPRILDSARTNLDSKNIENYRLFECNGIDLSSIKDESYDLIISTRCLQHISVHSIRYNYLKEFYRVLKPGGWLSAQVVLGENRMPQIGYYRNHWGASGTNGLWNFSVRHPEHLKKDLKFIGFKNFSHSIRLAPPRDVCLDRFWIFFKAQKPD